MTEPKSGTNAGQTRFTRLFTSPVAVLELGDHVATGVTGRFLLKLGATVTRVSPTSGAHKLIDFEPFIEVDGEDRLSATAAWLDEGKTVLNLDLSETQAQVRLNELVERADIVLIAGTTRYWAARGVSLDNLKAAASNAVIGHLTDWGDTRTVDIRGGELQQQALGGLMKLIGKLEREPVRLGGYPMYATTGLILLSGVMIGLFNRAHTGKGSRFSTSVFESVAHVEWKIASFVQAGRRKELRGEEGGGPVVVQTDDGHFAFFFVPRNWEDVKTVVGDPRLDDEQFATDAGRAAHQDELAAIIEDTSRTQSKKDLYYRAQALGIPAGHVATMTDLLESPQYRARKYFDKLDIKDRRQGEIPSVPWQILTADRDETRQEAS